MWLTAANGLSLCRQLRLAVLASVIPVASALAGQSEVERVIAGSPVLQSRYGDWTVASTLVPGFYALQPPSGRFAPSFYEEATGYVGSLRGWQEVTAGGLQPLGPELVGKLRQRIIAALDWSQGIKTVYGKGKNTAILFSAYDCPNCRRFEQRLGSEAAALNAVLYLFPQTLHANDSRGAQWVSAIWCGHDPRQAWRRLVFGQLPSSRARKDCGLTNRAATELSDMLGVRGVPALVTRRGAVLYGFIDKPMSSLAAALAQ